MSAARKKFFEVNRPYGAEIGRVMTLIAEGKSDAGIAALISAARPHGSRTVDPKAIADIRNGR